MTAKRRREVLNQTSSTRTANVVRRIVLFVVAGAALYLIAALWIGRAGVGHALGQLGAWPLLACALVASISYGVRFARWHMVLRQTGSYIAALPNLAVYLSGLALTATPGKVGETFRSVQLIEHGVPVTRSLGAFLTDRSSDVLGVCLLGVIAAWFGDAGWSQVGWAFCVLLAASMLGRRILLGAPVQRAGLKWSQRLGRRPGLVATQAVLQWAKLWTPTNVLAFTFLAVCAYGIQALVFAWICQRLEMSITPALAVQIFVNATLLGAASLLPGGLGAMEMALVLQLKAKGVPDASALAAAIGVRLVTLWCGIAIGVAAMGSAVRSRFPST